MEAWVSSGLRRALMWAITETSQLISTFTTGTTEPPATSVRALQNNMSIPFVASARMMHWLQFSMTTSRTLPSK